MTGKYLLAIVFLAFFTPQVIIGSDVLQHHRVSIRLLRRRLPPTPIAT